MYFLQSLFLEYAPFIIMYRVSWCALSFSLAPVIIILHHNFHKYFINFLLAWIFPITLLRLHSQQSSLWRLKLRKVKQQVKYHLLRISHRHSVARLRRERLRFRACETFLNNCAAQWLKQHVKCIWRVEKWKYI